MTLWIQDFLLWFKTFLRSSFVEDPQKPCSKQKRYCCKKKKRFKRSFIFFITHPCFFIAFKSVTSTKMTEVFKTASSATNKLQWHTHTLADTCREPPRPVLWNSISLSEIWMISSNACGNALESMRHASDEHEMTRTALRSAGSHEPRQKISDLFVCQWTRAERCGHKHYHKIIICKSLWIKVSAKGLNVNVMITIFI